MSSVILTMFQELKTGNLLFFAGNWQLLQNEMELKDILYHKEQNLPMA